VVYTVCCCVLSCARDLSITSITHLPTGGLQELDVLRLEDTETLKVFPSIYNFEVRHFLLAGSIKYHDKTFLKFQRQIIKINLSKIINVRNLKRSGNTEICLFFIIIRNVLYILKYALDDAASQTNSL
jgi:hypothetical protein